MAKKLVETPPPELSPGQYLACTADMRRLNGAKNKAVAEFGDCERRAITMGYDPKAYKLAQQLQKMGQEEAEAFLFRVRQYCMWDSGGEQMDLFTTAAEADIAQPTADEAWKHKLAMIEAEACTHALEGGELDDNRFPAGSEEAAAQASGHRIGAADKAEREKATDGSAAGKAKKASTRKDKNLGPKVVAGTAHQASAPVH